MATPAQLQAFLEEVKQINAQYEQGVAQYYDQGGFDRESGSSNPKGPSFDSTKAAKAIERAAKKTGVDIDKDTRVWNEGNNNDNYINLGVGNSLHDANLDPRKMKGYAVGAMMGDPERNNKSMFKDSVLPTAATVAGLMATAGGWAPAVKAGIGAAQGWGGEGDLEGALLGAAGGYLTGAQSGAPNIGAGMPDWAIQNLGPDAVRAAQGAGGLGDLRKLYQTGSQLGNLVDNKAHKHDSYPSGIVNEQIPGVPDPSGGLPTPPATEASGGGGGGGGGGASSSPQPTPEQQAAADAYMERTGSTTPLEDLAEAIRAQQAASAAPPVAPTAPVVPEAPVVIDDEHRWEYVGNGRFVNVDNRAVRTGVPGSEDAVVGDRYSMGGDVSGTTEETNEVSEEELLGDLGQIFADTTAPPTRPMTSEEELHQNRLDYYSRHPDAPGAQDYLNGNTGTSTGGDTGTGPEGTGPEGTGETGGGQPGTGLPGTGGGEGGYGKGEGDEFPIASGILGGQGEAFDPKMLGLFKNFGITPPARNSVVPTDIIRNLGMLLR